MTNPFNPLAEAINWFVGFWNSAPFPIKAFFSWTFVQVIYNTGLKLLKTIRG